MAPLEEFCFSLRKVLVVLLVLLISLVLFTTCSMYISAHSSSSLIKPQKHEFLGGRKLLEVDDDDDDGDQKPIIIIKKKKMISGNTISSKNQTKILKVSGSAKNQTKLMKTITGSTKNQTKIPKLISSEVASKNKTKLTKPTLGSAKLNQTMKSQFKKLNSTSKSLALAKNSTLLIKKSSDLSNASSAKNKTAKPTAKKETKSLLDKNIGSDSDLDTKSKKSPDKKQPSNQNPKSQSQNIVSKQTLPSWLEKEDADDEDDLVSGFRYLPSKFQETLFPDLERISKTSQVYLNKANKEMTRGFKPYVGNKYAPTIASAVSFAIIVIPLLFVSLIFNRIKAYFSLQKILIFIQIYLSIYFTILCLSSIATGLEPLKFLYATSQSTYVCLQVLQTLGYVLYLLLLLMYLILVFSTDTTMPTKLLGLGQIFVGFAVGLHYYVSVFHQAILHQPPKTSWKVHAIYATCFLLICILTRADRRKKAYLVDGGDEGKLS